MKTFGILGYPLDHTYSPAYYNERFKRQAIEAEYLKFELEHIADFPFLLSQYPDLCGFNVTIPHKENILPYLDSVSEEARAIGAVNCVTVKHHEGRPYLTGYNTDMDGFRNALLAFIPEDITQALVLGNGGAAKAIRYALHSLGIKYLTVSRTPQEPGQIGYTEVAAHLPTHRLVVNTTPLGTYPDTQNCPPIPYELLTTNHYLFDLVYNPSVTTFMQNGQRAGAHTCNGHAMLLGQAERNWDIWEL